MDSIRLDDQAPPESAAAIRARWVEDYLTVVRTRSKHERPNKRRAVGRRRSQALRAANQGILPRWTRI